MTFNWIDQGTFTDGPETAASLTVQVCPDCYSVYSLGSYYIQKNICKTCYGRGLVASQTE